MNVKNGDYHKVELVTPSFDSPVTDLIIELDHLRRNRLTGSTVAPIFFQLKEIFHLLESLESARIEGNRTTLAEIVDRHIGIEGSNEERNEEYQEIANVKTAIDFIVANVADCKIDKIFLSEIHKRVVQGLSPGKEGDFTPGMYRTGNVKIAGAKHIPPEFLHVDKMMDDLIDFINRGDSSKYDLLKIAIAHHRFAWIHPFSNGNGRTVRLLTYAMLVKQGFNIQVGRIINPTAVFCNDREKYYNLLAAADSLNKKDILVWIEYVLSGLKSEISKIDRLLDYDYLQEKILRPALDFSIERKLITPVESKVLSIGINKQIFQASDLKPVFPNKIPQEVSRVIKGLKDKNMIAPIQPKARKYTISFFNSYLMRGVINSLQKNEFIPLKDS